MARRISSQLDLSLQSIHSGRSRHSRKSEGGEHMKDLQTENDVVEYKDYPWAHNDELYSVAITGRAFKLLVSQPKYSVP